MRNRLSIVLAALAAATLFATGACDDDETTSSSSTTGTGGTTSSSGTGGSGGTTSGTGGDGGSGVDCNQACTDLFNCGLADDGSGSQYCPDWESGDLDIYLNGCDNDGCLALCATMPAIAALVDANDCDATITTISGASQDFVDACGSGIGGCGGGGGAAGGSGGAGGAGGQ